MTTKINPTETKPLTYRIDALRTISDLLMIPPTRISKHFGYTNNITVERWMAGKDIYTTSLIHLCNTFKLDLLSFFTYEDRAFQTNLGNIIAMEKAGLNLHDILIEKGVAPCQFDDFRTLSPLTPHEPLPAEDPTHPRHHTQPASIGSTPASTMPSDVLDRMIAFQCNAHEHEKQMLEQQRRDMQAIIDDKEKQIAKLEKELKRLRVIENASKPYMGIVADDSSAAE